MLRTVSTALLLFAAAFVSAEAAVLALQQRDDPNAQRQRPPRGRQYDHVFSPDGKLRAQYRDGNVVLIEVETGDERWITREGSAEEKVVFGTASWVYGEELGQIDAMGFSPDGEWLWFYAFDNRPVQDYYLALDVLQFQNRLLAEPYPKAGTPNPIANLEVVRVATGERTVVPVRPGPFDEGIGHLIYSIRFSPDSEYLWFYRANRRQTSMDWIAFNLNTLRIRTIIAESSTTGWIAPRPMLRHYKGTEWLWMTERSGYQNLMLVDTATGDSRFVTEFWGDVKSIVRVDSDSGHIFVTAGVGDNPYKDQFFRVDVENGGSELLSDPSYHHVVSVQPNGNFALQAQALDVPPFRIVLNSDGEEVERQEKRSASDVLAQGRRPAERFVVKAADGETDIYGYLEFPLNFDPNRKYPLLLSVYAGPGSGGYSERFMTGNNLADRGFIIASVASRGTSGRGVAFKHALYRRLGVVETDDQAAAVRQIIDREYIDETRVAIYGTSYGGYVTLMAMIRHPDLFQAGIASASVTDWRNYDTIYTERYMDLPQDNEEGYDEGSAVVHAAALRGRLMIFTGTADDNVHPANTWQMVHALDQANIDYELRVGADRGHAFVGQAVMLRFLNRAFGLDD